MITLASAANSGGGLAEGFVLLIALGALYFLPTATAYYRKAPSQGSVTIVNLFLGWTLLGWIIALAMAMRDPRPPAPPPAPRWPDQPSRSR